METCTHQGHCFCRVIPILASLAIGIVGTAILVTRWKKLTCYLEPTSKGE